MKILETEGQIREMTGRFQSGELKLGFVSAMGMLHEGHLALLRQAREMADAVLVMVYANPFLVQDDETLRRLMEQRPADIGLLAAEGVDYAYFPGREDLRPPDHLTCVRLEKLDQRFRGIETDQYLTGLATVYLQAMNLFQPNFIFVAQKNYLDFLILKRLIRDFHLSTEPVLSPTVRDENGLPYSSFHGFFGTAEKQAALTVCQALGAAREELMGGEKSVARLLQRMRELMRGETLLQVLFAGILNPANLEPLERVTQDALVYVVARTGKFRFTDNFIFHAQRD
jgi:pantoate--beta-alanine ligase